MANIYDHSKGTGVQYPDIETSANLASRFRFEWASQIFNPDLAQSSWFSRLSTFPWKKAGSPILTWDEETVWPMTDTTNGAILVGGTSLVVDNIKRWTNRCVARNTRTGENILVTNLVESTSTLTIVRSVGGTAAAAVNDADVWQIFLPARQEKSRSIEGRQRARTNFFNYIGQTSYTLDMSKVMRNWTTREGKVNEWKHQMEVLEASYRRAMVAAFFLQERSVQTESDGTNNTNVTYIPGGFRQFAINSTVNADNNGAPLTKSDLLDYFGNFSSVNQSTSVDLIMRPEIYFDVQRLWDADVVLNDSLPKKLQRHVQSINWGGVTWNFHREQVLKEVNDSAIYVVDTSSKFGQDTIVMRHMPTGGGTKNTNGKPQWILGQEDNDANWDKAQLISNCGAEFRGFATGMGAVWDDIGHN